MKSLRSNKRNKPKAEFIHDCPSNAGGPLFPQHCDSHCCVPRRLMSVLPVWVPKPGYIALDLEAKTRQIHGWQLRIAQNRQAEQEASRTHLSLAANVRPERRWRAAGGGGCGGGWSSKRSQKDPASGGVPDMPRSHRRRRRATSARTMTPATAMPATIQTRGLEAIVPPPPAPPDCGEEAMWGLGGVWKLGFKEGFGERSRSSRGGGRSGEEERKVLGRSKGFGATRWGSVIPLQLFASFDFCAFLAGDVHCCGAQCQRLGGLARFLGDGGSIFDLFDKSRETDRRSKERFVPGIRTSGLVLG